MGKVILFKEVSCSETSYYFAGDCGTLRGKRFKSPEEAKLAAEDAGICFE